MVNLFIFIVLLSFGYCIELSNSHYHHRSVRVVSQLQFHNAFNSTLENAKQNEFPWMVMIFSKKSPILCGGTLLNSYTVITTAHCVNGYENKKNKNT